MNETKKDILTNFIRAITGLFIYSIGTYLVIQAAIGIAPWECLSMGISKHIPFSYGFIHTTTSIVLLVVDYLLGEEIGFGTVFDAMLVGNFTNMFLNMKIINESNSIIISVIMVVAGLFIMGFGQYFYMKAGLCCGPRDSLFITIGRRLKNLPIGVVEILVQGSALLIGFILGGPVGLGTLISVLGAGSAMQMVFNILKFEPRNVIHDNIFTTTRKLLN